MDYIKEDGVWKIWKLLFCDIFSSPIEDGWVKTPFINNPPAKERPAPVRVKILSPTLRDIFSPTTIKIRSPGSKTSKIGP